MNVDFLKVKNYRGEKVRCLQYKADGHYTQVEKRGGVIVKTRTPGIDLWSKLRNTALARQWECLPYDTILCGELHCPGVQATSVKTMINEGDPKLQFTPFAMPFFNGDDKRETKLSEVNMVLQEWGYKPPKTIWFQHSTVLNYDQWAEEATRISIEGFVAKQAHFSGWFKIKPIRTVDAVVLRTRTSFAETTYGGLRGIEVGINGKRLAFVGTGFKMDYRMSVDQSSLVGRVAEIAYDCVTTNSRGEQSLRFPRFVRWRDDKPPNDCKPL